MTASHRGSFSGDRLTFLVTWQAGAFASARRVVTGLHSHVLKS